MRDVTLPLTSFHFIFHLSRTPKWGMRKGKVGITRVTKISHRDYCLNTNTEKMDGWMDGWIDGQTDRQTDRQTDS